MTLLFPRLNLQGSFTQRPSVGDLPSAVPSASKGFSLLLLAAQVLPKRLPLSFIRINMLINGFMDNGQPRGNLLWTPLHEQQGVGLLFHPWRYRAGVAAVLRSIGRHLASLFRAITARSSVSAQFSTDGGLVSVEHLGYLRLVVSGLHKSENRISFSLAEVLVCHKQLRLAGQETLNAKHLQPPKHQLIKVARLA
jgi:hypothetical protein